MTQIPHGALHSAIFIRTKFSRCRKSQKFNEITAKWNLEKQGVTKHKISNKTCCQWFNQHTYLFLHKINPLSISITLLWTCSCTFKQFFQQGCFFSSPKNKKKTNCFFVFRISKLRPDKKITHERKIFHKQIYGPSLFQCKKKFE